MPCALLRAPLALRVRPRLELILGLLDALLRLPTGLRLSA